jgi:hypothetical protein
MRGTTVYIIPRSCSPYSNSPCSCLPAAAVREHTTVQPQPLPLLTTNCPLPPIPHMGPPPAEDHCKPTQATIQRLPTSHQCGPPAMVSHTQGLPLYAHLPQRFVDDLTFMAAPPQLPLPPGYYQVPGIPMGHTAAAPHLTSNCLFLVEYTSLTRHIYNPI